MKKLSLLLSILTLSIAGFSQIRHVHGIRSVDLTYGATGNGQFQGLSFVSYWKPNLYMKASGFYENGKENGITYTSIGADFKLAKTLLKKSPLFYFNGTFGAMGSVDNPTTGTEFYDVKQTIKYGMLGGFEMELFISDKFVFIMAFDQRFLLGSTFGNYRWFGSGGIRYNF